MDIGKTSGKSLKILAAIGVCLILILIAAITFDYVIAGQDHYYPEYEKIDLATIITGANNESPEGFMLDEEDYRTLFFQTGLGRPAVDQILHQYADSADSLLACLEDYQNNFFGTIKIKRIKFGIITYEELIVDEEDRTSVGFRLAPIEDGDIFVSRSTLSLGWRHGHGAIVTDAKKRKTVEAVLIGHDSVFQDADKWRKYPSFILLRMKDNENNKGKAIANEAALFARDHMAGIPYGLFTGLLEKSPSPDMIRTTQCAHIVWYPYMQAGYDLDSDDGWMVTPMDIADSDLLEVVQIYGIDPEKIWPQLK